MPHKKNVQIKADVVTVNNPTNQRRARPVGRGDARRRKPTVPHPPPIKIKQAGAMHLQSGLGFPDNGGGSASSFTDQANAFVAGYLDPCGEHARSLDGGRVCDGALQTSAAAFFRALITLVFPWQQSSSVDLTGKTYSLLLLRFPFLRNLAIVLAKENDGDFGPETMQRFCKIFATMNPQDARYPNWLSLNDPGAVEYFTMIDTEAMQNIVPPDINGVSGTIDKYRFSSDGVNLMFNVPDLLNAGTIVSQRYPLNASPKAFDINSGLVGAEALYLRSSYQVTSTTPLVTAIVLNSLPGPPAFPTFLGPSTTLPSPNFVAPQAFRNAAGTFTVAVGNLLRYSLVGTAVVLNNLTTLANLTLFNLSGNQAGDRFNHDTRLYATSSLAGPEAAVEQEINCIVIPPVTQDDMIQQNPKIMAALAKETGGVYLPNANFQPIFNVQSSTAYRKNVFVTKETNVLDLIDPGIGWFDTLDPNFGVTVINMQGVPYAAKPLVKLNRSVEIVPASHSFAGAFAIGCPVAQPEAIDVCRAFTDTQPHGYNSDFNGFGILFKKIFRVLERLPKHLLSARNIAREVQQICDSDVDEEYDEPPPPRRRGPNRLQRVR